MKYLARRNKFFASLFLLVVFCVSIFSPFLSIIDIKKAEAVFIDNPSVVRVETRNDTLKYDPYINNSGKVYVDGITGFKPFQAENASQMYSRYYQIYNGVAVTYNVGGDGFSEYAINLPIGQLRQDDYIESVAVKQSDGSWKIYSPTQPLNNDQEAGLLNEIGASNGKGNNFSSGFYSTFPNSTQNSKDNRAIQDKINQLLQEKETLLKELNGQPPPTPERAAEIRKRIAEIDAEIARLRAGNTDIINNLQTAQNQSTGQGPSGVGFGACLQMFNWNFSLTGGVTTSQNPTAVQDCIAAVFNFLVELLSFPLIIAALFFDYIIGFTISNFGAFFGTVGGEAGGEALKGAGGLKGPVEAVWNLLRNLSNIIFIGALLYIAIKSIFKADTTFDRSLLIRVIVAAVLINFSLFFTKILIDLSNYTSLVIYNQVKASVNNQNFKPGVNGAEGASSTLLFVDRIKIGETNAHLAAAYISGMQLQRVQAGNNQVEINAGNMITHFFLSIIMIVVATSVFFIMGFMFLYRFLMLIVLMMTSPLAFSGAIFPQLKGPVSDQWRGMLKKQLVFAPVFMLMVYVSLQILSFSQKLLSTSKDFVLVEIVLGFGLTIGSMILCLVVANMAGGAAAGYQFSSKLGGRIAGGLTTGLAARLGRRTIGNLSQSALNNSSIKKFIARGGILSRATEATLKGGASSSYDIRNTTAGKNLGSQVNLGEAGGKGGYAKYVKEQAKRVEEKLKYVNEATIKEKEAQALHQYQETTEKTADDLERSINRLPGEIADKEKEVADNKKKQTDIKTENDEITAELITLNGDKIEAEKRASDGSLSAREKFEAQEKLKTLKATIDERDKKIKTNEIELLTAKKKMDEAERSFNNKTKELEKKKEDHPNAVKEKAKAAELAKAYEKTHGINVKDAAKEAKNAQYERKQAYLEYLAKGGGLIAHTVASSTAMYDKYLEQLKKDYKSKAEKEKEDIVEKLRKQAKKEKKDKGEEVGDDEEESPDEKKSDDKSKKAGS